MAHYTTDQLEALRRRWLEHETDMEGLANIIRTTKRWWESDKYRELIDLLGPLPPGVDGVKRDLRGIHLGGKDLSGGADLTWTELSGADLNLAKLQGSHLQNANLSSAILVAANLSEALLHDADLSGANLIGADFQNATLERTNLEGAEFWSANLSNSKTWIGARWNHKSRIWPRISRFDIRGTKLAPSERKTEFGGNDVRNANWSGAALLRRYVEDENFLKEYGTARFPFWRRILRFGWRWTCNYGRSFTQWALCSLCIAVLFGYLYHSYPCWFTQEMGALSPWYFSVVTFTTLGFGDLTPKPDAWLAQVCIMAEVIIGYTMLGGLISIFANKLARRA